MNVIFVANNANITTFTSSNENISKSASLRKKTSKNFTTDTQFKQEWINIIKEEEYLASNYIKERKRLIDMNYFIKNAKIKDSRKWILKNKNIYVAQFFCCESCTTELKKIMIFKKKSADVFKKTAEKIVDD